MDDVEMYKAHKGPVTELHIVDQYMMQVQFFHHQYFQETPRYKLSFSIAFGFLW